MPDSKRNVAAALLFTVALTCILTAGCGPSGPRIVPVSGRVTYQGQPVPAGMVMFLPVSDPNCRPGRAVIQVDGTFSATTIEKGDGLMVGEYQVTINPPMFIDVEMARRGLRAAEVGQEGIKSTEYPKFPRRYSDASKSGLRLTVDGSESRVTFDLPLADNAEE